MDKGKVSVIMGIYNCADTLPGAIDSICSQTYSNWELIMCDDASKDNTYEVAMGYKEKYPNKIKVLRHTENQYLSATLNDCLRESQGEYIARMDGDDVSAPDRFEKQVRFLESHPEIDLIGTAMQRFSDKGKADILYAPLHPDKYSLRNGTCFNHATIMTYKRVYDSLGGYKVSEQTKRSQDYELWFRFFYAGFRGDSLQEPLYYVREDEAAIKRRTRKNRINVYRITRDGYKLLNYPKVWLIKPAAELIVRLIVPSKLVLVYRNIQKKRYTIGKN